MARGWICERCGVGRDAERIGDEAGGIVDPREVARLVGGDQPATDRERRNADESAPVDQGELGGAAADVDMQDALAALLRQLDGAGAVGRKRAFELMAGGGADELAGLGSKQLVDRLGVAALDGLAR